MSVDTTAVLSPAELEAITAALALAWPQVDQFAVEAEEEDNPKLAAGMAEQADTLRRLYDRLVTHPSDGDPTEHYDYRIMVRSPGRRKWEYQTRVGTQGRDPDRLRVKIARERERSPGWRFKIERRKVVTFEWEWEDYEP